MVRRGECRRAPALHRVAAFAAAAVGTLGKLATVRIGLMAVGTYIVRNRRLEIPRMVATQAWNPEMFTDQRIARLRVVERLGEP